MWVVLLSLQDLAVTTCASLAGGLLGLAFVRLPLWSARRESPKTSADHEVAFLFHNGAISDASPSARRILEVCPDGKTDLARLVHFLAPRYPSLSSAVDHPSEQNVDAIPADDGRSRVLVRGSAANLRIALEDAGSDSTKSLADAHCVAALIDELKLHRGLTNGIGFPMWRQSTSGVITWANDDYLKLESALGRKRDNDFEPVRIFEPEVGLRSDVNRIQRAKLDLPNEGEPLWFEFQVSWVGDDSVVAAVPIDRVVRAERSLSGFVQTLTQTFAHLNVGLAVFNRARELAIFNPALSELLDLSPEFLVTRPSLLQMFDRLRETRMVPEPKDYKSWRRKMSALEAAASDTAYSETWSLVDGRTFLVTGRPHPEGAVAFLFEDISEEITLERKFRSDLQILHAVIDGLDEAIAVFSPSGALVMSNRAYASLWFDGSLPKEGCETFVEATRNWQHRSRPTPVWGDARDFAATMGERSSWTAEVRLSDGRAISCRFESVAGGFTLAGFSDPSALSSVAEAEPRTRMTA